MLLILGILILLKNLLKKGANVEYMEERDGWLPIHYAARWVDLKMLNYLIKAGANINGLTNSKETALHKCARWDRKDAAIILLKLVAITSIKNKDGEKASDRTVDPEIKFILDYFNEYQEIIKNKDYLHC
jgi:ankyrin repeat protein